LCIITLNLEARDQNETLTLRMIESHETIGSYQSSAEDLRTSLPNTLLQEPRNAHKDFNDLEMYKGCEACLHALHCGGAHPWSCALRAFSGMRNCQLHRVKSCVSWFCSNFNHRCPAIVAFAYIHLQRHIPTFPWEERISSRLFYVQYPLGFLPNRRSTVTILDAS